MSKQNYLCIQRSQPVAKREKPSPAQMEEMYTTFNAWKEKFQENIVDMGGRLAAKSGHFREHNRRALRGSQRGGRRLHDRLGRQPRGGDRSRS